jgi:uncharacterized protein (TIGR04255 family)
VPIESAEIYPNAPLRLVAFEVKYPLALKLASSDALMRFQEDLAEGLPIVELGMESSISFSPQQGIQEITPRTLFKLYSRNRRSAVTLSHTSLVIETSEYIRYALFRELVSRSLSSLAQATPLPGIARIGLRYVNEIRVQGALSPADWKPYISNRLLGPIDVSEDFPVGEFATRVQFDFGSGRSMQLSAATLHGELVSSQGPLRVDKKSGPFFLIDIDSFGTYEELLRFEPEAALDICDQLREPVREVFERSITDRLRNEVLRVESKSEQDIVEEVS